MIYPSTTRAIVALLREHGIGYTTDTNGVVHADDLASFAGVPVVLPPVRLATIADVIAFLGYGQC